MIALCRAILETKSECHVSEITYILPKLNHSKTRVKVNHYYYDLIALYLVYMMK